MKYLGIFFIVLCINNVTADPCIPKDFGSGSVVCVCNSTYCDTLDHLDGVEPGRFRLTTSSKDGLRFDISEGEVLSGATSTTKYNALKILELSKMVYMLVRNLVKFIK
jgi:hypothetical protein